MVVPLEESPHPRAVPASPLVPMTGRTGIAAQDPDERATVRAEEKGPIRSKCPVSECAAHHPLPERHLWRSRSMIKLLRRDALPLTCGSRL